VRKMAEASRNRGWVSSYCLKKEDIMNIQEVFLVEFYTYDMSTALELNNHFIYLLIIEIVTLINSIFPYLLLPYFFSSFHLYFLFISIISHYFLCQIGKVISCIINGFFIIFFIPYLDDIDGRRQYDLLLQPGESVQILGHQKTAVAIYLNDFHPGRKPADKVI